MNKIQIPWEDRPAGCADVMWRYSQNPVIGRYHIPSSLSLIHIYLLMTGTDMVFNGSMMYTIISAPFSVLILPSVAILTGNA